MRVKQTDKNLNSLLIISESNVRYYIFILQLFHNVNVTLQINNVGTTARSLMFFTLVKNTTKIKTLLRSRSDAEVSL
jgi:hypothetical protein